MLSPLVNNRIMTQFWLKDRKSTANRPILECSKLWSSLHPSLHVLSLAHSPNLAHWFAFHVTSSPTGYSLSLPPDHVLLPLPLRNNVSSFLICWTNEVIMCYRGAGPKRSFHFACHSTTTRVLTLSCMASGKLEAHDASQANEIRIS